jgi:ribosome maturation factor RimP
MVGILTNVPKTKQKRKDLKKTAGHTQPAALSEDHVVARAKALAEPLCVSEGLELVHLEFQREPGGRTLRIYIDKPGGVVVDDCVAISRQLSDLLDVGLVLEGAYNLEVSSPGINRPLGKHSDFDRFKGHQAKIKLARPVDGQKNFQGVLLGTTHERVKLQVVDRTVVVDFNNIAKAQLINYNGES